MSYIFKHLWQLINFDFIKSNLTTFIAFHCWSIQTLPNPSPFYAQFVQLNYLDEPTSATLYRFLWPSKPNKVGVFLDLRCSNAAALLDQVNQNPFYWNEYYHWLIYDSQTATSILDELSQRFENASLSVNTDLSYVIHNNSSPFFTQYTVYDLYNNGHHLGGKLNVTPNYSIQCDSRTCLNLTFISKLYQRPLYGNRNNLSDINFRVATLTLGLDLGRILPKDYIKYLLSDENLHMANLARLGFHIATLIIESLYIKGDKVNYSYYDCWTINDLEGGIIGALVEERADLGTAPFILTPGRVDHLRPLGETGLYRSVCSYRTQRHYSIQSLAFLEPFSSSVWLAFVLILVALTIVLWIAFNYEYHGLYSNLDFCPSLLTTILVSFGHACTQSSDLVPKSIAGRLAFFSLLFICFIIYNYYTSVVVAILLGSPVKTGPKTISEVADSNFDVGVEPATHFYSYFNTSKFEDVQRLVKRKIKPKLKHPEKIWYSPYEGVQKLLNTPDFLYIFETSSVYYLIEINFNAQQICDLNEFTFRQYTFLYTQLHRNSTYKEIVKLKILRILETGIYAKHRKQWIRLHLNCQANTFLSTVGLENTAILFILLIIGMFIALIIFILEILEHKLNKY